MLVPGKRGLAVGGRPVGSPQPSPLLSETSQDRAMSRQVRAMVPPGRRHSSLRLLVQVPGEGGVRGGTHTGPSSPSPFISQPPQQPLSYQIGLPAWGRCGGRVCVWGPLGGLRPQWWCLPLAAPAGVLQAPLTALALSVVTEVAVREPGLEDPPIEGDADTDGGNIDAHPGGPGQGHGHAVLAEALPHPRLVQQDLGA